MRSQLYKHSISAILKNQAVTGAFIASPNFAPYNYCWYRDGAFTAYAMDITGQHDSSRRFHEWAVLNVLRYRSKMLLSIDSIHRDDFDVAEHSFHSRFLLDGNEDHSAWPNHQLDGLGTWLWSLCQHLIMVGKQAMPESWASAVNCATKYLSAHWSSACYDCWEENGGRIHTYTLAAIYAGLNAVGMIMNDPSSKKTAGEIQAYILENAVYKGRLVKFLGSTEVDASLIGVAIPYRVLELDSEVICKTVACIEKDLQSQSGGLHRYRHDTYFGGGEWILLTAWLGWYYAEVGSIERAKKALDWVEGKSSPEGDLPEQVSENLIDASYLPVWKRRWGQSASPLVWSHSMYLILYEALDKRNHNPQVKGT